MKLTRKAIPSTGVYQHFHDGVAVTEFSARVVINHRQTWRKLVATNLKKAITEAHQAEYSAKSKSFSALAQLWVDAGCSGKKKRPDAVQLAAAKKRADSLVKFFGKFRADEIRLHHLPQYREWRVRQLIRSNSGGRTVDLDLVTLSNILRYGVFAGMLEFNFVRADRPRYQTDPRHAREVMPASAEEIHKIAEALFVHVRSQVMGWLSLFSEFTGCRTSELLRLRTDAKTDRDAGFITWFTTDQIKDRDDGIIGQLSLGRRSKNGMNPYSKVGPEFGDMLKAFQRWHATMFGVDDTNWFFPGQNFHQPVSAGSLGHALVRVTKDLSLPHITPHGFRAYYATKRLRDGARTVEIAAEMGDKTVELINKIYADNPDGAKLWWTPADGLPAWQAWLPKESAASMTKT
jgi:integrase